MHIVVGGATNCTRGCSPCGESPLLSPCPLHAQLYAHVHLHAHLHAHVSAAPCAPSQDRFGEHSSELDSITHALAELSTPESALHDGELPLHGRPAEMLDNIRRHLHTWEHEDLWREFCEYVPASWTSREHVLTVVPASWPPPAGS